MQKVDYMGHIVAFNANTSTLTFQIDFLTPELIDEFVNLANEKKPVKHTFQSVKKIRSKTYQQQKQFWVDVHKVLKKQDIIIDREVLKEFYDFVKRSIFPARRVEFGTDSDGNPISHYYAPEMKDLTIEEMAKVITDFRSYYEHLKIDWDQYE